MSYALPQPPLNTSADTEDPKELRQDIRDLISYLETLRRYLTRIIPQFLEGSATFDPANLVDGAGETTTVTVQGARLGMLAFASFSLDVQGITVTAAVSAANTVSVRFQNETGGALNLGSGTLRAYAVEVAQPAL